MTAGQKDLVAEYAPRLTPTQRLHDVTLAALNRTPRPPQESVTISRNAKGDVQIEVSATTQEGESLDDVGVRASELFNTLCTYYDLSRAQIIARDSAGEKVTK